MKCIEIQCKRKCKTKKCEWIITFLALSPRLFHPPYQPPIKYSYNKIDTSKIVDDLYLYGEKKSSCSWEMSATRARLYNVFALSSVVNWIHSNRISIKSALVLAHFIFCRKHIRIGRKTDIHATQLDTIDV